MTVGSPAVIYQFFVARFENVKIESFIGKDHQVKGEKWQEVQFSQAIAFTIALRVSLGRIAFSAKLLFG